MGGTSRATCATRSTRDSVTATPPGGSKLRLLRSLRRSELQKNWSSLRLLCGARGKCTPWTAWFWSIRVHALAPGARCLPSASRRSEASCSLLSMRTWHQGEIVVRQQLCCRSTQTRSTTVSAVLPSSAGWMRQHRKVPRNCASRDSACGGPASGAGRVRWAGIVSRRCNGAGAQFLGLTALNPATLLYFTAILTGLSSVAESPQTAIAFIIGAGVASFGWQALLVALGASLRLKAGPSFRMRASVLGNGRDKAVLVATGCSVWAW